MQFRRPFSLLLLQLLPFLSSAAAEKVPLIFDNDGNYDDTLALMYLASNPLFDLKAVTLAGAGFATHHGGPVNMRKVLDLFGKGDVPVSYGRPMSLSPISAFPLQWRVEMDEFFQVLPDVEEAPAFSVHTSDKLIAKVLRESETAVAVVVIGPATNLALALQEEPELVDRISGIFLMGSNYGDGAPNNVYDWQMEFNGILGGCLESAAQNDFVPSQSGLRWHGGKDGTNDDDEMVPIRPGCRGNSMSETGDTEWNVFLDAMAWHVVTRTVAESENPPPIHVIATGATEEMPITMDDFEDGLSNSTLDEFTTDFIHQLAEGFLGAGEAKWWDAQLVVAMADVISGVAADDHVCREWLDSTGFKVSLEWDRVSEPGVLNPYGSIKDIPGIGPDASFCRHGHVEAMQKTYWDMLNGVAEDATVADPSVYLRSLPSSRDSSSGASSSSRGGTTFQLAALLLAGLPVVGLLCNIMM